MANEDLTPFVLAGGKSQRFGSNKALARFEGKPLISHVTETLLKIFLRVFVVTKTPELYGFLTSKKTQILKDLLPGYHPLNGLCSALRQSPTEINFICACDMPFLQESLIQALVEAGSGYDAVIPHWKGKFQPFCGIYSKKCLPAIESLMEKESSLEELTFFVRTRFLREEEITALDPQGLSFRDIDTQEDLEGTVTAVTVPLLHNYAL